MEEKVATEDQLQGGTEDCQRISTDICLVIKGQFVLSKVSKRGQQMTSKCLEPSHIFCILSPR